MNITNYRALVIVDLADTCTRLGLRELAERVRTATTRDEWTSIACEIRTDSLAMADEARAASRAAYSLCLGLTFGAVDHLSALRGCSLGEWEAEVMAMQAAAATEAA